MKTAARYTKSCGNASVHATTRVQAWQQHQLIESDVGGQLDSEQHFRILTSAGGAEALDRQLLDVAVQTWTTVAAT
ncbi:hypothetical protein [Burkholderia pseudomultivorans]|uniref:Uncharacterized protein n=1 Tax=Burkholderia pseudomultivorans TaxID=1207504 RepID=A0A132E936_9BURK|nr:hypothetical protein [Burkholderia pseudomultivorans]KWF20833.1 hypothetical protein WT56_29685 [Burkholderia pseudomultivorans]